MCWLFPPRGGGGPPRVCFFFFSLPPPPPPFKKEGGFPGFKPRPWRPGHFFPTCSCHLPENNPHGGPFYCSAEFSRSQPPEPGLFGPQTQPAPGPERVPPLARKRPPGPRTGGLLAPWKEGPSKARNRRVQAQKANCPFWPGGKPVRRSSGQSGRPRRVFFGFQGVVLIPGTGFEVPGKSRGSSLSPSERGPSSGCTCRKAGGWSGSA